MRTLHRYLTRQVLLTLGMSVAVFTFLLLLTNLLKEILALLVSRQATLGLVAHAIVLLIPFVMAFALPMGMLTAALLVFGRFSADQELTAARASGLSLISLVTPVLGLSLVLSVICGLFNLQIAPQCRVAYKEMLVQLGLQQTSAFIQEHRFNVFPGWVVYARKKEGNHLRDVRLYALKNDKIRESVTASDALLEVDSAQGRLRITLTNATTFLLVPRESAPTPSPATTDSTNEVSHGAIEQVEGTNGTSVMNGTIAAFDTNALGTATNLPAEPTNPPAVLASEESEWRTGFLEWFEKEIELPKASSEVRKPKLSNMSFQQLRQEIREREGQGIDTTPAKVQLHRQIAFSFASLGFTLIGIPLGIRAHRRETTAGIALAIVLVLVYYGFIVLAQSWDARTEVKPHLIVWFPNFLFQGVGAALLWKANRG
jgi:lipopolysaccharide export system permease protein